MSSKIIKPLSFAVGAALIGSVALAQSSFAMTPLASGYMLADAAAAAPMAKPMDKHMEGKCGMEMADTNKDGMISADEHATHAKMMFDRMDTNHDGMVSKDEMMAGHKMMGEGKCGEGKCGHDMQMKGMHDDGMKHDDDAADAAERAARKK